MVSAGSCNFIHTLLMTFTYTYIQGWCIINSRHDRGVWLQCPTKIHYLWCFQAMPLYSNHSEASFSPNWTDLLCLQVAKVPRCWDLAIFLLTMTTTMTEPITLSLAHVCRVKMVSLPYEGTSLSISCSLLHVHDRIVDMILWWLKS